MELALSAPTPTTPSLPVRFFGFFGVNNAYTNSEQSPGTSTSISNTSLKINGSLTVSGAALEFQLVNASVAVSGDLRIEQCMSVYSRLLHIAIDKYMFCLSAVLNVSLSSSWSPSSSPIVVEGAFFLDSQSSMAISLPTNPYSGVAPITVGGSSSLQG